MSGDGLRILVTSASRHGSTTEIAGALAARLDATAGLHAVSVPVEHHPDPARFDAVLVGSAVYVGHWLDPAREWVTATAGALRGRPVWLFSSGPIGEPPFPPDEPYDVGPLVALTRARASVVFPGRLEKQRLGFGERAMVTAMRAPTGDFRDWAAIAAWADSIAVELLHDPAVHTALPGAAP